MPAANPNPLGKLDPRRLTTTQTLELMRVDRATLKNWRAKGCPHVTKGNQHYFDLRAVFDWRVAREASKRDDTESEGDGEEEMLNPVFEKARLDKAKADAQEMTNAERRGELIEVRHTEEIYTSMVMATRAAVLALGSRLAPELVGMTTERQIKRRIDEEGHTLLTALSKDRLAS